jgi:hypothetical protein
MSYFNKILNGNIPLSIIECINGYNDKYRMYKDYPYMQINPNTHLDEDMKNIFNSDYGKYIKSSMSISRNDIIVGVKNIIKASINNNYSNFAENFMKIMKNLKMSNYSKQIFILIVNLTGFTNENYSENKEKLLLLLELGQFKVNNFVNIQETINNKIKDSSKIDDLYIDKLAQTFVSILEEILENILESTKHDKLCNFYAFTIEIANSLASYVIENFAFGGSDTTTNTTTNIKKNIQDISKNIDQSSVIKGMNSLLTNSITNAMNSNTAEIMTTIQAENKLSLAGVKGSSFTLKGINQSASVTSNTEATVKQKITTKIMNDITNELTKNIKSAASNTASDVKKQTSNEQTATNVGTALVGIAGVIGNTVNHLADKAADILSFGATKSTTNTVTTDEETRIKNQYSLNSSFKVDQNNDVNTKLQNLLDSKNIAKCGNDALSKNTIDVSNIDVTGAVVISDISQNSVITDITKCIFDQEIMNDISSKLVNSFNDMISNMSNNIDTKLDEQTKAKVDGDIAAVGIAGAAIISSAGTAVATAAEGAGTAVAKAAEGVGTGVSTGAQGIGTGVSTGAEGVGKGLSGVFSALAMPLFFFAIIACIGGFFYLKMTGQLGKFFPSLADDNDEEESKPKKKANRKENEGDEEEQAGGMSTIKNLNSSFIILNIAEIIRRNRVLYN